MKNKKRKDGFWNEVRDVKLVSLVSSWWSSFGVALSAVDWPASVWFEGNFTFLSTVSADCLVQLFIIHSDFQLLYAIMRKNVFCTRTLSKNNVLNLSIQKLNSHIHFMKKEKNLRGCACFIFCVAWFSLAFEFSFASLFFFAFARKTCLGVE